jgi:hypothetical protein
MRKDNGQRIPKRVLDLCNRIGMAHEVDYLFAGRFGDDVGPVGYVPGGIALGAELPAYLYLDTFDFNSAFLPFAIEIVAVAGGESEEKAVRLRLRLNRSLQVSSGSRASVRAHSCSE